MLLKAKNCGRRNSFHSNSPELLWVQTQKQNSKNVAMGCKKKHCLGFGFPTQTCKKKTTANYQTIAAQLIASGDAISNSSLQLPCKLFRNCCEKTNSLQLKRVESHVFRQSGQKHSFQPAGANKAVMETSHMFPFLHCWMQKHIQN